MTDWIHCNLCSTQYAPSIKLFLSECGHLTCEKCIEKTRQTGKCAICSKATTVKQLTKDIDPSIYDFFLPFENHMKKLMEIYNFQKQHKEKLHQVYKEKYNYAKNQCLKSHSFTKELVKENKMLRSMLKQSSADGKGPFTSTPLESAQMAVSNPSPNPNMSWASSISTPGYARRMNSQDQTAIRRHLYPSVHQQNKSVSTISSGPSPAQIVPGARKVGIMPRPHRSMPISRTGFAGSFTEANMKIGPSSAYPMKK